MKTAEEIKNLQKSFAEAAQKTPDPDHRQTSIYMTVVLDFILGEEDYSGISQLVKVGASCPEECVTQTLADARAVFTRNINTEAMLNKAFGRLLQIMAAGARN